MRPSKLTDSTALRPMRLGLTLQVIVVVVPMEKAERKTAFEPVRTVPSAAFPASVLLVADGFIITERPLSQNISDWLIFLVRIQWLEAVHYTFSVDVVNFIAFGLVMFDLGFHPRTGPRTMWWNQAGQSLLAMDKACDLRVLPGLYVSQLGHRIELLQVLIHFSHPFCQTSP